MAAYVVVAALMIALPFYAGILGNRLLDLKSGAVRSLFGMVLVGIAAFILFRMKVAWLRGYAVIEMLFASVFSARTLFLLTDQINPVESLTVMAGIYLMVRGMDNFKKDLDERKKLPPR